MKNLFIILTLLSSVFSQMALAGANTPTAKIDTLNIGAVVWVTLKDGNSNTISFDPTGCANDPDTFALPKTGNENFDQIFRGLLLARGTDSNIKIWVTGCYEHHNGKIRPTIDGVNVL